MPKKFKGVNSKAEEARTRKDAIRVAEREKKQKEEEDRQWEDDDKCLARKQNRKDEREKKKAEQLERKATAKQELQDEENQLNSKAPSIPAKLTRSQIQSSKEKEEAAVAVAAASSRQKKKTVQEQEPEENPNQAMAALLAAQGAVEARSVEDAITTLTVQDKLDMHPEKRRRAAYAEFEERELPRLKKENPNLRLSQLKQMLKKDWMKSPENPLNQQF